VIDAVPGPTAVTTPVAETVATLVVLEDQVTVRATPASASTFAASCNV
jgi:hypothetical protein